MDIEHFEIARRLAFDMENEYRRLGLDPSYRLDDDLFKTALWGHRASLPNA
jgi:hypothetical protein